MTVKKNFFDTSAVEAVIELVMSVNPEAIMVDQGYDSGRLYRISKKEI